ncbi:type III-A CRISPR-associated protein Cas10/Csm1 [Cytobacillus dafuensis]|uniref:CRISPR system single-strand-specific deoxyribonuclease Cas10/Csm1 (subtype III-A) n=1 Tax=Cytobacillus dafuensis TaxID=1742359 RepID=A0A5B8Z5C3_CYTDA|nr:type III-A CRISPR-associated protein Cas10/Csm1 [Cytobacillus dafuensis]QED48151.1 type III-A CRISPR-associated protein Cas10/Csm1 [Cytobacillus dafuensis]
MSFDKDVFIKRAEYTVLYALYARLKIYAPIQAMACKNKIAEIPWGEEWICSWDHPDSQISFYQQIEDIIDEHPTALESIFSHLHLFQEEAGRRMTYYEPEQWDKPVYYPSVSRPNHKDLYKYWEKIGDSFHRFLSDALQADSEVRISQFFAWAELWLTSIAAGAKYPFISLAEYLKTLSAIIIALRDHHTLKIVLGDVSGIQSYLFDIARIGTGNVAKRLRARSFALGLLAESSAHRLLLDTKMPIHNLVLSAGGIFYALIPGNESLECWKNSTNNYFYQRFHGSISLNTAEMEVSPFELWSNFPDVLSNLHEMLQIVKGQPFNVQIMDEEGWIESCFIHNSFKKHVPCESCYKFPKQSGEDICEYCSLDEKIGQILPKTNYLLFKKGPYSKLRNKRSVDLGNDICVELAESGSDADENTYLIQSWNQSPLLKIDTPIQGKWMANFIPLASKEDCENLNLKDLNEECKLNSPLTFSQLSAFSKGKHLIGYFKADVDRLGMLFSVGLINERKQQSFSLMHIVMLSKQLERFFSGGINDLLCTKYKRIYTVFSGGDDLFFIGPWSEIMEAAKEVRQKFYSFAGLNKEVSISAGISIVKPNMPLPHVAKEVEKELEKAKEVPNRFRRMNEEQSGRDQIALFDTVMTWEDFNLLNGEAIMIANWWNEGKISSAFLYQLVHFSRMYQLYKEKGDTESLKFIPMLAYSIRRNMEEAGDIKTDQRVLNWANALLQIDDDKTDWLWGYIKPIIQLSALYRRREEMH